MESHPNKRGGNMVQQEKWDGMPQEAQFYGFYVNSYTN